MRRQGSADTWEVRMLLLLFAVHIYVLILRVMVQNNGTATAEQREFLFQTYLLYHILFYNENISVLIFLIQRNRQFLSFNCL